MMTSFGSHVGGKEKRNGKADEMTFSVLEVKLCLDVPQCNGFFQSFDLES